MADLELLLEQTKEEWRIEARRGEETLAVLTAAPHGDSVLVHNTVAAFSPGLLRLYREVFKEFRAMLAVLGYRLVQTCSDRWDEKMQKYWRLMGFVCFTEMQQAGKTVKIAVMGVNDGN